MKPVRGSSMVAVVVIVAVVASAAIVACLGPGGMLMKAGGLQDGACWFAGHSAVSGAIDVSGVGSSVAPSVVALAVALVAPAAIAFAQRRNLPALTPAHVRDDPRHGRLRL